MTTLIAMTADQPSSTALWLVCAPQAWAWGWGHQQPPEVYTEATWPEGEPPLAFPADLWQSWWLRAKQGHPGPYRLRVLCAHWGRDAAPDWWPQRKANVRPWQAWCEQQGLELQSVQLSRAPWAEGECRAWVQQARWRPVTWIDSKRSASSLQASRWRLLRWSGGLALACHACMMGAVWPAWSVLREQARTQAQAQRQQAEELKAQSAAQTLRLEQAAHVQQWRGAQQLALQPLHELSQWLQQIGPDAPPQLWLELRQAQGRWTVLGVTDHERTLHELFGTQSAPPQATLIQSSASTWPPEPALGWPAWRFEWQTATEIAAPGAKPP